MPKPEFRFKRFTIRQDRCALKVGTDGVLFGAWANYEGARRILDIGTGTGVLALIAAQRNNEASIDAVEIDDASAEQAAENVAASPWSDRVRVHRMDVRRMKAGEPYDLIICNPPCDPAHHLCVVTGANLRAPPPTAASSRCSASGLPAAGHG